MATPSPLRSPSLKPKHWIDAAFARLAREGIDSVRIEVLARDLSVSKGSFYWHFKDREELLTQMLGTWEAGEVEWLSAEEGQSGVSPAARWAKFVERGANPETMRSEIAIRSWARRDEQVAMRLSAVEERKTRLLAGVLRDIGFAEEAAVAWAGLILLTQQGWLERATRAGEAAARGPALGAVLSEMVLAASRN